MGRDFPLFAPEPGTVHVVRAEWTNAGVSTSQPVRVMKAVTVVGAQPGGRSVFWITSLLLHFTHEWVTGSQQARDNQAGAYRNYFVKALPKLKWNYSDTFLIHQCWLSPLTWVVLFPSCKAVGHKDVLFPRMKIGTCSQQQRGGEVRRVPGRDHTKGNHKDSAFAVSPLPYWSCSPPSWILTALEDSQEVGGRGTALLTQVIK